MNLERLILYPILTVILLIGGTIYLLWCAILAGAAFLDWVNEEI